MKKCALVLITLCLLCMATVAYAVTAQPGQTVTVTVNVTTSGAWCSVGFNYDSSVLTFVSASGGNVAPNSGSGRFIFGSGTAPIGSASGSITFRVSDSAAPGTYNVSAYKVECYDTAYNDVGASVSGGSVTVVGNTTPTPNPVNPYTPVPTYVPGGPTPTPKPTSTKTKTVTAVPQNDQGIYNYVTEDEDGIYTTQKVNMFVLGLAKCIVKIDGVKTEVPTLAIELSEDVKPDHQLAVVYAPNSGLASLRKTEKSGSEVIVKMEAGAIVVVKQIKGDYTQVVYNGRTGWVKNTSLKYYAACEEMGKARVDNGNAVKLYLNRDNDSWVITKLSAGAELSLIREYKEWYEVDWNGYHGFIYKKYVKVTSTNE